MGPVSPQICYIFLQPTNTCEICHQLTAFALDLASLFVILLARLAIFRRCLFPYYSLPFGLPIQATENIVCDSYLSSEHKLKWKYMLGHPSWSMESGAYCIESVTFHLFSFDWSQPWWSACTWNRADIQDQSRQVWRHSSGVDQEICSVICAVICAATCAELKRSCPWM